MLTNCDVPLQLRGSGAAGAAGATGVVLQINTPSISTFRLHSEEAKYRVGDVTGDWLGDWLGEWALKNQ